MITENGIRIQNIYYMLSYAFQELKHNGYEKLANETFENTADLLATILLKGIIIQIKRGLGKEYIDKTNSLSTIRGKINIAQSIKEKSPLKKQLVCTYDEFSSNTKLNQILKTTVFILLKENIKLNTKKELKKYMIYFKDIDLLNPYQIDWNIKYNKNNQNYQMLISICNLIIKGLLQKDIKGDMKLEKFLDEQKMSRLYEKFILEFYKQHYPNLLVSSSQIDWNLTEETQSISLLPKMQSDITISKKDKSKILIIDAKFYKRSMATSQYTNKSVYHSNNLYQIFTYVKNKDIKNEGNVIGMLLYAKTDEEVVPDSIVNICNNNFEIRNLDLNNDFTNIKNNLHNLIKDQLL